MPSTDEGTEAFKKLTRNCSPWVRSLVHSPEAVIHSPAEIAAAWPTAVTRSRWPRALIRSTQKPVSGLWKVTRSTRPASTSRPGAASRRPAWPAGVRSRWPADGFGPGFMGVDGIDAPICQDTRSGGLDDRLASAEIGHDALVDLASEETFQAPDDLSLGSAVRRAACDVINGRLMVPHADDDGSREGGVGVSVAASMEAVPAGGHPGRGRDRTRAAALREGGVRTNPVGIIAEDDQ